MYKTKMFYVACACMSLGAILEDTDRADPRHLVFSLSGEMDFEKIAKEFSNGTLMVNASRFAEACRNLKSVVHAAD